MALFAVEALPATALAAASRFHAEVLPEITRALADTGDLVLVFAPADHTHHAWRLAAVQGLARQFAPARVNAVASDSPPAIAAAQHYLECAPGLTGQLLALDSIGAGRVVQPEA